MIRRLKCFGIMLILVMVLVEVTAVLGFGLPQKTVSAASYVEITYGGKVKTGSLYISRNDKGIYVSKSKKEKGKLIVEEPKEPNATLSGAMSDGKTIYYLVFRCNKEYGEDSAMIEKEGYAEIYKIEASGKNNKRLGKTSQGYGCNMVAYCNNSLYITIGKQDEISPWIRDLYEFNLTKRKIKKVAKDITRISGSMGRYLIGERQIGMTGWYSEISVYDTKTKNKDVITKYGGEACFIGNKVYYSDVKKSDVDNYTSKYSVVSHLIRTYDPKSKKKKTISTVKANYVYEITTKYAKYYRGKLMNNTYYTSEYKYTFATKKENKIK